MATERDDRQTDTRRRRGAPASTGLLGLLLLAACADAAPPSPRQALAAQLQDALGDALGVPVRMGEASFDLGEGHITAHRVEIDATDGLPLLRARTLRVEARLDAGALRLGEVVLSGAELSLRIVDGAVAGLPTREDPEGPPQVRRVVLHDSHWVVTAGPRRMRLRAAEASFTRATDGLTFSLDGGQGHLRSGDSALRVDALDATGRATGQGLYLDRLQARGPDGTLSLAGAHIAEGAFTGTATLSSTLGPWLSALGRAPPPALADAPVRVELTGQGDTLTFTGTHAPHTGGQVVFDGRLSLDAELHTELRAQLSQLPASTLSRWLPALAATRSQQPLDATLTLKGSLTRAEATGDFELPLPPGAIDDWRLPALRLRGGLSANGEGLTLGEVRAELQSAPTRFAGLQLQGFEAIVEHPTPETLRLRRLSLRGRGLLLKAAELTLQTGARSTVEGTLQVERASLAALAALAGVTAGGAGLDALDAKASGTLQLSLASRGESTASMQLSLADSRLWGQRFPRGELRVQVLGGPAERSLQVESLVLRGPDDTGRLQAKSAPGAPGAPATQPLLSIMLDALPVTALGGKLHARISGSGELATDGSTPNAPLQLQLRDLGVDGSDMQADADLSLSWRNGKGVATLSDLRLSAADTTLRSTAPVPVHIADGSLSLASMRLSSEHAVLTLWGHHDAQTGLTLQGEGHVDGEWLADRSDWASAAYGKVPLSLSVAGTGDDLHAGMSLRPDGLIVVLEPWGIWVQDVVGEARHDGTRWQVGPLRGRFGGGRLALEGTAGPDDTRLALRVRGVTVEPDARLRAAFDADLEISRGPDDTLPTLGGELRLRALRYARRIGLPGALAALDAAAGADDAAAAAPARVALDLHLRQAGTLRVHNNLLDAELHAPDGLRLMGTDRRFGLLGSVELDGGRMTFRGDEFTLSRGRLHFDDRSSAWPSVDLAGEAPARQRRGATIAFTGNGDRERFALELHCRPRAGDDAAVPAPFRCDYAPGDLRCGDYDRLLSLFLCQPD